MNRYALRGKLGAGNSHSRFEVWEVPSSMPRCAPLLYKRDSRLICAILALILGHVPAILPASELTDRFVAEARRAYATQEYADYQKSVVDEAAYRKADRKSRADLGDGTVRWIDVEGTCNFRDIGGWTGLRKGLVYRGAEPNCHTNQKDKCHNLYITQKGERTLSHDLGIRTDLDLRAPQESPTPDETPISRARLVRISCSSYTEFLRATRTVAKLLRVFAREENYPIYFHCYGGADRTGSLAFLLEGICGVSEADLSIDYELTSFSRIGTRRRVDRDTMRFGAMVREMMKRPGKTLQEKIEHYVTVECGLKPDEVAAIRKILLPQSAG